MGEQLPLLDTTCRPTAAAPPGALHDARDEALKERDEERATFALLTSTLDAATTYARALERDMRGARLAMDIDAARLRDIQAILDGRTTAPTYGEIHAHHKNRGRWLIAFAADEGGDPRVFVLDIGTYDAKGCRRDERVIRWWSLDTTGRPCAWPVIAPTEQGAT